MNKEEMTIGKEYLNEDKGNKTLYVYERSGTELGYFRDNKGHLYVIPYSCMTEAPTAKPEFAIDDEIEVSSRADFKINEPTRGKFKYLDPDGDYWIAKNSNGLMFYGKFARKVEPMVIVRVFDEALNGWRGREVSKELADKIIAGDHSR
jgi:hypothetical protein